MKYIQVFTFLTIIIFGTVCNGQTKATNCNIVLVIVRLTVVNSIFVLLLGICEMWRKPVNGPT